MTTAIAATWPTEASLKPATKALNKAFSEVEAVMWSVDRIVSSWMDGEGDPDPAPTLETIGTLWSFLETLRIEGAQLHMEAEKLKEQLGQISSMRYDLMKVDDA